MYSGAAMAAAGHSDGMRTLSRADTEQALLEQHAEGARRRQDEWHRTNKELEDAVRAACSVQRGVCGGLGARQWQPSRGSRGSPPACVSVAPQVHGLEARTGARYFVTSLQGDEAFSYATQEAGAFHQPHAMREVQSLVHERTWVWPGLAGSGTTRSGPTIAVLC